jgi:hypothetical protein
MKNIDKIHAAMMKVMQEHPPYYSWGSRCCCKC